jgi:hypothetical protein
MTECNDKMEEQFDTENTIATELQAQGIEPEKGCECADITTPFDPKKVDIGVEQITLYGLISRIEDDAINLMPDFQRQNNLWSNTKMSQLIESILIRLPLPAMYMDVANEEEWVVVDGLQRLSTLKKFVVDRKLKLQGLEFLKELEGLNFDELDRIFQRRILETNITVIKIKKGTPRKVLTSLFHRINTGGTKLTAQEIRHALNQGQATKFLNEIAESDWFKNTIKVSPKRMLNKELIIRFIAFYRQGYKSYKQGLQQFLDDEMEMLNQKSCSDQLEYYQTLLKNSLDLAQTLFGIHSFTKGIIGNSTKALNRSLFEATTVNFAMLSQMERCTLKNNSIAFLDDYKELLRDADFNAAISTQTHTTDNTKLRHRRIQGIISKHSGHAY